MRGVIYNIRGRPHLGGTFYPNISLFPSFIVNMAKKNHHKFVVVFHVSKFFLLSSFCLFCLSFSSLPLLFDILKPKKVPTRWGLWHAYIYICICVCGRYLQVQCGNVGFQINHMSLQIWNALFPRMFAGTNCKHCKNKQLVGLWCVISNIAGSLNIL